MTYAFLYALMTLGAFGVVVALGERGESLEGYRGLAIQRPLIALMMFLFLLSLTGIPPTAGFVAKFVVILSVVRTGHLALAVLAVLCSVISAFVYLRIAVLMYMKDPEKPLPAQLPLGISVALSIAAVVTIVGGILPRILVPWVVAP
jgi:NADH-quinone oxidoreductase subunit N